MKTPWRKSLALLAASFLALPSAFACSVCYGEPDSPTTQGLTWAIVALAGIVGVVLTGVTAFFVHLNRRASALDANGTAADPVDLRSGLWTRF